MRRQLGFALGLLVLSATPGMAWADDNDLVMARLGTAQDGGVVGSHIQFRSLASELGVVFAPRLSEPADTLGFGGFHFTADVAVTSISNSADYWRTLESSTGDLEGTHGDGAMVTTGIFVKKGIWLPLPSFEVGFGAVHLGQSNLWAAQGYVKFALHEGYHDLPLPSIAVRGAASRMMGSEQLDLSVASLDVTASKDFGIGGLFRFSPYVGWNWLAIVPRSDVVDKTPHIDSRTTPEDGRMNFVFKDQDNIYRNRALFGGKIKYHIFTLTVEGAIALRGTSVDDRTGTDMACSSANTPTTLCDAKDTAGRQTTLTTTLGLDF